jgi:ribonuclease HII
MPVVIGIDEAGYAPNLGPFVIGGSLWQVESPGGEALANLVDKVSRALDGACADDAEIRPLRFADSKKVFDRAEGPASLEPDVLALLACCCELPLNAKSLFASAASVPEEFLDQLPGYSWQGMKVPAAASLEEIVCRSRALATGLETSGVRPLGLAANSLYPGQWNDGVDQYGNKATLLGVRSLALIRELLDVAKKKCPDEKQISICCDKHGGRNHYAAMLQEELAEGFVRVVAESRETSVYVWRDDEAREFRITFSARGDSEGPVAVASMLAKYLRELAMAAWNAYWIREVPGLLPTAGYPVDAKRFRRDIRHVLRKMSIPDEAFWRNR